MPALSPGSNGSRSPASPEGAQSPVVGSRKASSPAESSTFPTPSLHIMKSSVYRAASSEKEPTGFKDGRKEPAEKSRDADAFPSSNGSRTPTNPRGAQSPATGARKPSSSSSSTSRKPSLTIKSTGLRAGISERELVGLKGGRKETVEKKEADPRKDPEAQEEKRFVENDDEDEVGIRSVLGEARAKFAMVEKRTIDHWKAAAAQAKAASAEKKLEERARHLEEKVLKLEDELRDSAAIEVALYSVVAEHGSSSHKVHTPARRLARLYLHAFKNWSPERRASSAWNSVSGLILVIRACGNDIPRLIYWWSNVVVLRETIGQVCDVELAAASAEAESGTSINSPNSNGFAARALRSQQLRKSLSSNDSSHVLIPNGLKTDWRECSTFVSALLSIEAWIHARVLESVWWQAMTPPMQIGGILPVGNPLHGDAKEEWNKSASKVKNELDEWPAGGQELFAKEKVDSNLHKLGDTRQGNISVEIWKRAFTDALKRLCPLHGEGHECGCLPVLKRMIIEECVERLDVAMFNGIVRDPQDDSPTEPLADPITNILVLPIPIGGLTFGAGSQLKNVVVNWSTWISALVSFKDPSIAESINGDGNASQPENAVDEEPVRFSLLKATGDLLMLPKEILLDKDMRKEVCPGLSLPLMRRVLCNFVPDEFSPDPVSPALLAGIDTELSMETKKQGEADTHHVIARVPPVTYTPPSSHLVRLWIGDSPGASPSGLSTSSLLRKGYTSDDELEEYQNPLVLLQYSLGKPYYSSELPINGKKKKREESGVARRYQLLKEVWATQ